MKSIKQKPLITMMVIVALALAGIGVHSYSTTGSPHSDKVRMSDIDTQVTPSQDAKVNSLKDFNDAIVNIAEKTNPTVVTVFTSQTVSVQRRNPFFPFFGPQGQEQQYERQGLGSGVIVDESGYILTNNHVVEGADTISVRLYNDQEVNAEVVGADPMTDIAVLKINAENLPAVEMGDSDALRVGEFVLAIGSPLSPDLDHTVTMGIVSATGRSNLGVINPGQNRPGYENFIQTDAAINPGNSGGALINSDGKLVGINAAIVSKSGDFAGIGFAIPINMARNVMESIMEHGKVVRGYLGIYMGPVTKNIASIYELDEADGVIISDVVDESPAAQAGLKTDDIILKVDGNRVKGPNMLATAIASKRPGDKVKLTLLRDGDQKTITVKLGEMPEEQMSSASTENIEQKLGFATKNLNDDIREELNLSNRVEGVVVTGISQRSNAYRGGLREGDVIVEFNRRRIGGQDDFNKLAEQLDQGDPVVFRIIRGNRALLVDFRL
jgi:serine protease Do